MGLFDNVTKIIKNAADASKTSEISDPKDLVKNQPYYCSVYKVRGTNPETGRQKTAARVVEASNATDEQIGAKSGLLPPYEIECVDRPMTEAQSSCMIDHGFIPPSDLTVEDASIFIQRDIDGRPLLQVVAPVSFTDFAIANNIVLSRYASRTEAQEQLLRMLPKQKKEIQKL